ncbi:ankyrin repeat domain-containing protein [Enterobacter cloacae]|uniref:Ankyrin repeat domain-containing protein n=1 Tax=Enterobacter cloacae TaxID=550 RepID=A0A2T4Y389_ENTCL|nr:MULTISPECIES: ankyrin repeat domain-containing protein [Enterobacter cloacae complex]HDT2074493.1 ankyrin repeat domain-containing protein [Enterobacter roggenkampii]HEG2001545.1 ankyrin repeat domain-containing protein [Enterobacter asburiae]MCD2457757.1 ankyrin repeat domain-containing protein [Enterobacter cloacae complex sp. 2021EL-01261]MDT9873877.1 ankyrin repeat domain-containing protein [Enterobacter cloacae]PTM36662.1 ankyrin repeat domain-containing protein [Enterobacter cloacae]
MNKLFVSFFVILFSLLIQGCKQNMDLNPQDYFSGQQLALAENIQRGDIDGVEKLIPQNDLNKPGKQDMTLLFWALGNSINENKTPSRLKIITLLVKSGADPLQPRPQGKNSPAEFVLNADSADWINALLDGGLSPNAKDKTFHEPIIFEAIKAKNTNTLEAMLDRGANINITDSLNSSLLFEALNYHAYDHVILLLKRGADTEIRAKNGWAMGNQLQRYLERAKEGSDEYKKLNEIKELFIQHGGKWPPAPVSQ